jgi:hypothetical protein
MDYKHVDHEFNPTVAESHGVNAAIIFQYIAYRSRTTPGHWVSLTLGDICKQYPYLGNKQIRLALDRLVKPVSRRIVPLIFRKGSAKGVGFIYAPSCRDYRCDSPHTFNVQVAREHGVAAAVIYSNVGFWIRQNWIARSDEALKRLLPEEFDLDGMKMQEASFKITRNAAAHHGSIEKWAEAHPYISRRDAYRSFARLVQAGLLNRTHASDRTPIWTFPPQKRKHIISKMLDSMVLKNNRAI